MIGLVVAAAGLLLGYEVLKAKAGAAAAPPPAGRAPVPPSQAAPEGVAASIAGHVLPTPPTFTRQQIEAEWKTAHAGEGKIWWNVLAGIPWPDATGLWRTRRGALYQFRDCGGNPIGQPGYMPLQYQAWLQAGVNCDGQPFPPQSVPGNMSPILATVQPGAAAPGSMAELVNQLNAGTGSALAAAQVASGAPSSTASDVGHVVQGVGTVAGTAATIAGAVGAVSAGTAGGVSAAAGVAAGIGAALCCLGPIPAFLMPARVSGYAVDHGVRHASWIKSENETLLVDGDARTLGVNVARCWDDVGGKMRFTVAAIEIPAADTIRFLGVAGALAAMYDDHAHQIVGVFDSIDSARAAAEIFAAEWQNKTPTLAPCVCGPLSALEEPLA